MPKLIDIPDIGEVEFPDVMSEADILDAIDEIRGVKRPAAPQSIEIEPPKVEPPRTAATNYFAKPPEIQKSEPVESPGREARSSLATFSPDTVYTGKDKRGTLWHIGKGLETTAEATAGAAGALIEFGERGGPLGWLLRKAVPSDKTEAISSKIGAAMTLPYQQVASAARALGGLVSGVEEKPDELKTGEVARKYWAEKASETRIEREKAEPGNIPGMIAEFAGSSVPSIIGSVVTVNPLVGAAVTAGLQSFGSTYSEAMEQLAMRGVAEPEARDRAAIAATLDGLQTAILTRVIPGGEAYLAEALKRGGKTAAREAAHDLVDNFFKTAVGRIGGQMSKEAVLEGVEEGLNQVLSGAIARYYYAPDKSWQDIWDESLLGFSGGLILGGGMGGIGRAISEVAGMSRAAEGKSPPVIDPRSIPISSVNLNEVRQSLASHPSTAPVMQQARNVIRERLDELRVARTLQRMARNEDVSPDDRQFAWDNYLRFFAEGRKDDKWFDEAYDMMFKDRRYLLTDQYAANLSALAMLYDAPVTQQERAQAWENLLRFYPKKDNEPDSQWLLRIFKDNSQVVEDDGGQSLVFNLAPAYTEEQKQKTAPPVVSRETVRRIEEQPRLPAPAQRRLLEYRNRLLLAAPESTPVPQKPVPPDKPASSKEPGRMRELPVSQPQKQESLTPAQPRPQPTQTQAQQPTQQPPTDIQSLSSSASIITQEQQPAQIKTDIAGRMAEAQEPQKQPAPEPVEPQTAQPAAQQAQAQPAQPVSQPTTAAQPAKEGGVANEKVQGQGQGRQEITVQPESEGKAAKAKAKRPSREQKALSDRLQQTIDALERMNRQVRDMAFAENDAVKATTLLGLGNLISRIVGAATAAKDTATQDTITRYSRYAEWLALLTRLAASDPLAYHIYLGHIITGGYPDLSAGYDKIIYSLNTIYKGNAASQVVELAAKAAEENLDAAVNGFPEIADRAIELARKGLGLLEGDKVKLAELFIENNIPYTPDDSYKRILGFSRILLRAAGYNLETADIKAVNFAAVQGAAAATKQTVEPTETELRALKSSAEELHAKVAERARSVDNPLLARLSLLIKNLSHDLLLKLNKAITDGDAGFAGAARDSLDWIGLLLRFFEIDPLAATLFLEHVAVNTGRRSEYNKGAFSGRSHIGIIFAVATEAVMDDYAKHRPTFDEAFKAAQQLAATGREAFEKLSELNGKMPLEELYIRFKEWLLIDVYVGNAEDNLYALSRILFALAENNLKRTGIDKLIYEHARKLKLNVPTEAVKEAAVKPESLKKAEEEVKRITQRIAGALPVLPRSFVTKETLDYLNNWIDFLLGEKSQQHMNDIATGEMEYEQFHAWVIALDHLISAIEMMDIVGTEHGLRLYGALFLRSTSAPGAFISSNILDYSILQHISATRIFDRIEKYARNKLKHGEKVPDPNDIISSALPLEHEASQMLQAVFDASENWRELAAKMMTLAAEDSRQSTGLMDIAASGSVKDVIAVLVSEAIRRKHYSEIKDLLQQWIASAQPDAAATAGETDGKAPPSMPGDAHDNTTMPGARADVEVVHVPESNRARYTDREQAATAHAGQWQFAVVMAGYYYTIVAIKGGKRYILWAGSSGIHKIESVQATLHKIVSLLASNEKVALEYLGEAIKEQPVIISDVLYVHDVVSRPDLAGAHIKFGRYDGSLGNLVENDVQFAHDLIESNVIQGEAAQFVREHPLYQLNYPSAGNLNKAQRDRLREIVLAVSAEELIEKNSQTLKSARLTATLNGNVISVKGNTYEHKDLLKQAGARFSSSDKAWEFRDAERFNDFIRRLSERLAERGVGTPAGGQQDTGGTEEDNAADRFPDEWGVERGANPIDIKQYCSPETMKLLEMGTNFGIPIEVIRDQIEDIARIVQAYVKELRMFLLASEPGTGKTFVLGGAIREMVARGAKKIIYVTNNQNLIEQIKRDLKSYGITDKVVFMTYAGLRKAAEPDGSIDVLIFDEAHAIKNVDEERQQALVGARFIKASKFVVFSSATPYENPVQMRYLEPTGFFEPYGGYEPFVLKFGAQQIKKRITRKIGHRYYTDEIKVYVWNPGRGGHKALVQIRNEMRARDIFTARKARLPENMVESRLVSVASEQKYIDWYEALVEAAASIEPDDPSLGKGIPYIAQAWLVNFQKRLLEASKVNAAIEIARDAIKRGRNPVIFVETKAERVIDIEEMRRRENQYLAMKMKDSSVSRADFGAPPAGLMDVLDVFQHKTGIAQLVIPSAEDVIAEALKEHGVGIYTGSISDVQAAKNLQKWRSGEYKVLVVTMAKGGTGLSLHDVTGNHPTTQININMPWTATQVVQVTLRTARYGLASKAEIAWLYSREIGMERQLARKVGGRMRAMGAIVHGAEVEMAERIIDFDVNDTTFREMLEVQKMVRQQNQSPTAPDKVPTAPEAVSPPQPAAPETKPAAQPELKPKKPRGKSEEPTAPVVEEEAGVTAIMPVDQQVGRERDEGEIREWCDRNLPDGVDTNSIVTRDFWTSLVESPIPIPAGISSSRANAILDRLGDGLGAAKAVVDEQGNSRQDQNYSAGVIWVLNSDTQTVHGVLFGQRTARTKAEGKVKRLWRVFTGTKWVALEQTDLAGGNYQIIGVTRLARAVNRLDPAEFGFSYGNWRMLDAIARERLAAAKGYVEKVDTHYGYTPDPVPVESPEPIYHPITHGHSIEDLRDITHQVAPELFGELVGVIEQNGDLLRNAGVRMADLIAAIIDQIELMSKGDAANLNRDLVLDSVRRAIEIATRPEKQQHAEKIAATKLPEKEPEPRPLPKAEATAQGYSITEDGLIIGVETEVVAGRKERYKARYALVPFSMVVNSFDEAWNNRPEYAPLVNTRNYRDKASEREKVIDGANSWDAWQYVTDAPSAAVGPIIVIPKVVGGDFKGIYLVVGGNGRKGMMDRMSEEAWRSTIELQSKKAGNYGLPAVLPDDPRIKHGERYVLVRLLTDAPDLSGDGLAKAMEIVDLLNPSPGQTESTTAKAWNDAPKIPFNMLSEIRIDDKPDRKIDFVAALIQLGVIDRNTRVQITESKIEAEEYVNHLIINAAYANKQVNELRFTERTPETIKAIIDVLAPIMIALRQRGEVANDLREVFINLLVRINARQEEKQESIYDVLMFVADQAEFRGTDELAAARCLAFLLAKSIVRKQSGEVNSRATVDAWTEILRRLPDSIMDNEAEAMGVLIGKPLTLMECLRNWFTAKLGPEVVSKIWAGDEKLKNLEAKLKVYKDAESKLAKLHDKIKSGKELKPGEKEEYERLCRIIGQIADEAMREMDNAIQRADTEKEREKLRLQQNEWLRQMNQKLRGIIGRQMGLFDPPDPQQNLLMRRRKYWKREDYARRLRLLSHKRDQKTITQAELRELEMLERIMGQAFMDFYFEIEPRRIPEVERKPFKAGEQGLLGFMLEAPRERYDAKPEYARPAPQRRFRIAVPIRYVSPSQRSARAAMVFSLARQVADMVAAGRRVVVYDYYPNGQRIRPGLLIALRDELSRRGINVAVLAPGMLPQAAGQRYQEAVVEAFHAGRVQVVIGTNPGDNVGIADDIFPMPRDGKTTVIDVSATGNTTTINPEGVGDYAVVRYDEDSIEILRDERDIEDANRLASESFYMDLAVSGAADENVDRGYYQEDERAVRVLGRYFMRRLRLYSGINLVGLRIGHDYRFAAQLFSELLRNPFFEVATIVPLKNGVIAGPPICVSCGNMNYTVFADLNNDSIRRLIRVMQENGCDSYLVVHNHPTGDPRPSEADMAALQHIRESSEYGTPHSHYVSFPPGFAGFIIINHNKAYYISPEGEKTPIDFNNKDIMVAQEGIKEFMRKRIKPAFLRDPNLIKVVNRLHNFDDRMAVMMVDANMRLVGWMDVDIFAHPPQRMGEILHGYMMRMGGEGLVGIYYGRRQHDVRRVLDEMSRRAPVFFHVVAMSGGRVTDLYTGEYTTREMENYSAAPGGTVWHLNEPLPGPLAAAHDIAQIEDDYSLTDGAPSETPMTVDGAMKLVNRIAGKWKDVKVVVVNNPEWKVRGKGVAGARIGGQIYLNLAYITGPADLMAKLVHEAVGHLGMRGVLGNDFENAMLKLFGMMTADQRAEVERLAAMYGTNLSNAVGEWLARQAEKPNQTSLVKRLWQMFVDFIAGVLGVQNAEQYARSLLRRARKYLVSRPNRRMGLNRVIRAERGPAEAHYFADMSNKEAVPMTLAEMPVAGVAVLKAGHVKVAHLAEMTEPGVSYYHRAQLDKRGQTLLDEYHKALRKYRRAREAGNRLDTLMFVRELLEAERAARMSVNRSLSAEWLASFMAANNRKWLSADYIDGPNYYGYRLPHGAEIHSGRSVNQQDNLVMNRMLTALRDVSGADDVLWAAKLSVPEYLDALYDAVFRAVYGFAPKRGGKRDNPKIRGLVSDVLLLHGLRSIVDASGNRIFFSAEDIIVRDPVGRKIPIHSLLEDTPDYSLVDIIRASRSLKIVSKADRPLVMRYLQTTVSGTLYNQTWFKDLVNPILEKAKAYERLLEESDGNPLDDADDLRQAYELANSGAFRRIVLRRMKLMTRIAKKLKQPFDADDFEVMAGRIGTRAEYETMVLNAFDTWVEFVTGVAMWKSEMKELAGNLKTRLLSQPTDINVEAYDAMMRKWLHARVRVILNSYIGANQTRLPDDLLSMLNANYEGVINVITNFILKHKHWDKVVAGGKDYIFQTIMGMGSENVLPEMLMGGNRESIKVASRLLPELSGMLAGETEALEQSVENIKKQGGERIKELARLLTIMESTDIHIWAEKYRAFMGKLSKEYPETIKAMRILRPELFEALDQLELVIGFVDFLEKLARHPDFIKFGEMICREAGISFMVDVFDPESGNIKLPQIPGYNPVVLSLHPSRDAVEENQRKLNAFETNARAYLAGRGTNPQYDPVLARALEFFLNNREHILSAMGYMPESVHIEPSLPLRLFNRIVDIFARLTVIPRVSAMALKGLGLQRLTELLEGYSATVALSHNVYRKMWPQMAMALRRAMDSHNMATIGQYQEYIFNPLAYSYQHHGLRPLRVGDSIGNGHTVTREDIEYLELERQFHQALFDVMRSRQGLVPEVSQTKPVMRGVLSEYPALQFLFRDQLETGPKTMPRHFSRIFHLLGLRNEKGQSLVEVYRAAEQYRQKEFSLLMQGGISEEDVRNAAAAMFPNEPLDATMAVRVRERLANLRSLVNFIKNMRWIESLINDNAHTILFGYIKWAGEPTAGPYYGGIRDYVARAREIMLENNTPISTVDDLVAIIHELMTSDASGRPNSAPPPSATEIKALVLRQICDIFVRVDNYKSEIERELTDPGRTNMRMRSSVSAFTEARGRQLMPGEWYDYGSPGKEAMLMQVANVSRPILLEFQKLLDTLIERLEAKYNEYISRNLSEADTRKLVEEGVEYYTLRQLADAIYELSKVRKWMDVIIAEREHSIETHYLGSVGMLNNGWRVVLRFVTARLLSRGASMINNLLGGIGGTMAQRVLLAMPSQEIKDYHQVTGATASALGLFNGMVSAIELTFKAVAEVVRRLAAGLLKSVSLVSGYAFTKTQINALNRFAEWVGATVVEMSRRWQLYRDLGMDGNYQLLARIKAYLQWIEEGGEAVQTKMTPGEVELLKQGADTPKRRKIKRLLKRPHRILKATLLSLTEQAAQGGVSFIDGIINRVAAGTLAADYEALLMVLAHKIMPGKVEAARKEGYDWLDLKDERNRWSVEEVAPGVGSSMAATVAARRREILRLAGIEWEKVMVDYWRRRLEWEGNGRKGDPPELFNESQRNGLLMAFGTKTNYSTFATRPLAAHAGGLYEVVMYLMGWPTWAFKEMLGAFSGTNLNRETKQRMIQALYLFMAFLLPTLVLGMMSTTLRDYWNEYIVKYRMRAMTPRYLLAHAVSGDGGVDTETAVKIAVTSAATMIPFVGNLINNLLDNAARNGYDLQSQVMALNLLSDAHFAVREAIETGDPVYSALRFAVRWIAPDFSTRLLNVLPGDSGRILADNMEVRSVNNLVAQAAAAEKIEGRRSLVGGAQQFRYTSSTPYIRAWMSAMAAGDADARRNYFNELVQARTRELAESSPNLDRSEIEKRAFESAVASLRSRNPFMSAINRLPTRDEYERMMRALTPEDRRRVEQYLQRFDAALEEDSGGAASIYSYRGQATENRQSSIRMAVPRQSVRGSVETNMPPAPMSGEAAGMGQPDIARRPLAALTARYGILSRRIRVGRRMRPVRLLAGVGRRRSFRRTTGLRRLLRRRTVR